MKDLIHGQEIVDVNRFRVLLEGLNEGRVNQHFVALTAFFQAGENGVIETDHGITHSLQTRGDASTYLFSLRGA